MQRQALFVMLMIVTLADHQYFAQIGNGHLIEKALVVMLMIVTDCQSVVYFSTVYIFCSISPLSYRTSRFVRK